MLHEVQMEMCDRLGLPLNTYFALKEVKAPVGYVLEQTEILFNTDYQGQDVDTIKISKTKKNKQY